MAGVQDLVELVLAWTTLYADSTAARTFPVTGWMTAAQFAKFQGDFELCELGTNVNVSLGYQTANVENAPDAAVAVGSYQNTAAVFYASGWTDTTANTDGKRLFRVVFLAKLSSGTTLALGRAGGKARGLKK